MYRIASPLRTRPPVDEEGEEVGWADDPPTLSTAMQQALAERLKRTVAEAAED